MVSFVILLIMDTPKCALMFPALCVLLVATLGSRARGHVCPLGQLAHDDYDRGVKVTRCCLPVDCDPHFFVSFCKENGTADTCEPCDRTYKLFKRTSSFAVENCHYFPLDADCKPTPGSVKASEEDKNNCYCDLEQGEYYHEPDVKLPGLPSANCQIAERCSKGHQPNQKGECELCPRGYVQDRDRSFRYCRPLIDCARLGLDTEIPGSTTHQSECAKPPASTTPGSAGQTPKPTTKDPSTVSATTTSTPPAAGGDDDEGGGVVKVKPSTDVDTAESPDEILIIAVTIASVLVITAVVLIVVGRRKGWFKYLCKRRQRDVERSDQSRELPMSNRRNDNDNSSDNSCCACADSCLSTSSKPSSSKSAPTSSSGMKPGLPVPMMEAHANCQYMNGKAGLPMNPSFSEPLYNSISQYGSKVSDGNMATYKNVPNGGQVHPATMLRQDDLYYSKGYLSSDDDDDHSLKKGHAVVNLPAEPRKPGDRKDSEDFKETDPLLPNEDASHNGTPVMVPFNRGIAGNTQPVGGGNETTSTGNRPNLSILLASVDNQSGEDPARGQNIPCLSQIMPSVPSSAGSQVHDRQLQQQALQAVSDRQQLLQQQLLQQHLQQQLHEGPTMAARVSPGVQLAGQQELNPSAVTMEELKPVMPLNPTHPGSGSDRESPRQRQAQGSPARIKPSQQEEVTTRKGAREVTPQRPVQAARPTTPATNPSQTGAAVNRESEETFRKDVLPAASPDEETGRKSVGGSSGLGESLDISSPLSLPSDDEARRSRAQYKRSISEVSRSVSPSPVPLPRSVSSPEEKHRNVAVVKPMQSDQSLNDPADLMQPLESAARNYPLRGPRVHGLRRDPSQDSSDDPDATRPKTPDRLSEAEDEDVENDTENTEDSERTRATFFGSNDSDRRDDRSGADEGKDKSAGRGSDG